MILILHIVYLMTGAMCYEVNQNDEYGTNPNVTTLYPVKGCVHTKEYNNSDDSEAKSHTQDKIVAKSEEQPKNQSEEYDLPKESTASEYNKSFRGVRNDVDDTKNKQDNFDNGTDVNNNEHEKEKPKVPKLNTNNWKIDTYFTPSKLDKQEGNKNDSENKTLKAGKEFKPSPQLGHFYSEDAFVVPTKATIESFTPVHMNPPFFSSSPGDFYKLNYKPPTYSDPKEAPYKFENTGLSRDKEWKHMTGIEAKPAEAPVKIPAGGLYKLPDPFKEKPGSDGDDDNFGLEFKDDEKHGKENPVKKRGNPWKSLLHLLTALLPVGIILSALTPNIITLENVDNQYPNRFSRRSGAAAAFPPISENCRRRLLCELHSDSNYHIQSPRRQKHCYKIQCDDPQELSKVLHWLLLHNRSRGYQPDEYGTRGYIT